MIEKCSETWVEWIRCGEVDTFKTEEMWKLGQCTWASVKQQKQLSKKC